MVLFTRSVNRVFSPLLTNRQPFHRDDDFYRGVHPGLRQKLIWSPRFNHDFLVCTRITPLRNGFRTIQTGLFTHAGTLLAQRPISIAADCHIPTAEITAILELLKECYNGGPFNPVTICVALWSSKTKTALKDFHLFTRSAKTLLSFMARINIHPIM